MKESITLVMFLFLLLIVSGCCTTETSKSQTSITLSIEAKAEDVINDCRRDQTSAEQKYKNKNVKLTGKVS